MKSHRCQITDAIQAWHLTYAPSFTLPEPLSPRPDQESHLICLSAHVPGVGEASRPACCCRLRRAREDRPEHGLASGMVRLGCCIASGCTVGRLFAALFEWRAAPALADGERGKRGGHADAAPAAAPAPAGAPGARVGHAAGGAE